MDNTQALQQVTAFISAGKFRRIDLSAQVYIVVEARREEIWLTPTMTIAEKTLMSEDLNQQVLARMKQFVPTWGVLDFGDLDS